VCPYCGAPLAKMPGRKKKCPACCRSIYVRTRPLDRQRVLLTEAELPVLDAQWSQVHTHSMLSRFDEPGLTRDQQWAGCNRELVDHAKNGDWGLYRNTRLHMASLLHREGRRQQALVTYLEASYIDLNGPRNMGGVFDRAIVGEFPPFSCEDAMLAPAVVELTCQLAAEMNLKIPVLQQMFVDMAEPLQRQLRLPVSPQMAWRKLKKEMDGGGA
jgi:hypothetical protein